MRAPALPLAVAGAAAALTAVAAGPGPAAANGRFPTSVSVETRPGDERSAYLAVTFGLLVSDDDGCRWRWICEENIGYGGDFDPKYRIDADGTIYATTYDGLRVSRDGGCSFETATADQPPGPDRVAGLWVDAIDLGADGVVWIGTAESGGVNAVYRSDDQARTFTRIGLESKTIWWKSLAVAPSDPRRVYVSGYQVAPEVQVFVRRTRDGGQTWEDLPFDFLVGSRPLVLVEGVDPIDPDVVYARSVAAHTPEGDRLYRSADGGASWTPVLDTPYALTAFTVRRDGGVVAGTLKSMVDPVAGCTYRSMDRGQTFSTCEPGPQMACVGEREDGTLLACGANWDPDYFTVGRSLDGASWEGVLRFHTMAGPLACPDGSPQRNLCELKLWPMLRENFAVEGPGACAGGGDDGGPDAGTGGGNGGGCCDAGAGGGGAAALGLVVLAAAAARRRRRRGPPAA